MNKPNPERIYGVRDKWKDMCAQYQEMKEKSIKLLEHPESTEEQLLEVARMLRDLRKQMNDAKDTLNRTYPSYAFDLKGSVKPMGYLKLINKTI